MSVFSLNCQKRHSTANTYAAPKLDCKNKNGFYINQAHTKVKPIQFYVKICNIDRLFPKIRISFNELFRGNFTWINEFDFQLFASISIITYSAVFIKSRRKLELRAWSSSTQVIYSISIFCDLDHPLTLIVYLMELNSYCLILNLPEPPFWPINGLSWCDQEGGKERR